MDTDLLTYFILSFLSILLGIMYFVKPRKSLIIFFVFSLIIPTSNQFMNIISLSGIYFFDYFFLFVTIYYFFFLSRSQKINKKNIFYIVAFLTFVVSYFFLAYIKSIVFDKYLLRDFRPFLTLFYAFILISHLKKNIITFRLLAYLLIFVFVFKILFFLITFFAASFSDEYYQANIFRYFDAVTFIASLVLISNIHLRKEMLIFIDRFILNFLLFSALLVILISNLRILIFAIIIIYFLFSKRNILKKIVVALITISFFLIYSFVMSADRVLESNKSEVVAFQLASRFSPAIDQIINMKPHEYIYGLGLGTYFDIPWFEYRSLDTKLNTIDSTYLTFFVKYGLCSASIFLIFFRLLLFNTNNVKVRKSIIIFYLILFITMSTLYQSGAIFHFLFLNLLFLSLRHEDTPRTLSINS